MSHIDPDTEYAVRHFLQRIAGRYLIADAFLYGSRARGTHDADSDADVAIVLRGKRGNALRTAWSMTDVTTDVLLETGINISPLPIWLDEWEHPEIAANPMLLDNIAREGVRL